MLTLDTTTVLHRTMSNDEEANDGYGHQSHGAGGWGGDPESDPFYIADEVYTNPRFEPANEEFDSSYGGGEMGHAPHVSVSSIESGSTNTQPFYYSSATMQPQVGLDTASSDLISGMAHVTLDSRYDEAGSSGQGPPLPPPVSHPRPNFIGVL